ncbi:subtilisin-like serine protease [Mesotoga prima MesG1.Ag.4.2]|uniref:Subtilisin-like serine protease n=1 Tax=Mesotoga prima MesG1.Ag.4.2 TaxID=660470 RepID=I2F4L2_9BACT|nr:S8 family peptidase [Mesotoga prima]AFK06865.1 subtilisin-like serine protease [Mesotoga prima MesG1.Ag.4.2]
MKRNIAVSIGLIVLVIAFMVSGCVKSIDVPRSPAIDWSVQAVDGQARVIIGFSGLPDKGLVKAFGGEVFAEFGFIKALSAKIPVEAIDGLLRNPHVVYVEPNIELHALEEQYLWGMNRIFGEESFEFPTWETSTGAGVKVAILDTGIDPSHPDLAGRVSEGVDFTGIGSSFDDNGHGTHVSGTVAAIYSNNDGVYGVAPDATLVPVKVLSASGSGTLESIIWGIQWAIDNDIDVINMSLGTSSDMQSLEDACNAAFADGILIVAAAGNSGNKPGNRDTVEYPGGYASVIAVAASDSNDARATFSSTGPDVELIAPGVSILSTIPGGDHAYYSGTSMASPHVAGVAALVLAAKPTLTNAEVRLILQQTAENLGLKQEHQGYGLVRADLAVQAASVTTPPASDTDPEPGTVTVSNISYSLSRNAKHMYVSVQLDPVVVGASVSIEVYLNNGSSPYFVGTITTDTSGVTKFTVVNAPSGSYSTVVTDVSAAGYTWDGVFPENSYSK